MSLQICDLVSSANGHGTILTSKNIALTCALKTIQISMIGKLPVTRGSVL